MALADLCAAALAGRVEQQASAWRGAFGQANRTLATSISDLASSVEGGIERACSTLRALFKGPGLWARQPPAAGEGAIAQ